MGFFNAFSKYDPSTDLCMWDNKFISIEGVINTHM